MSSDDDNEADTVDPEHASLVAHQPAKSASLSMSCPPSLWMVSSAIGLSLLGDSMLYAVLPVIHREINIPVEAVGVLLSANRFVRLVSNVAAGSIVIRYGRRIPFLAALIMAAAVTTSYGLVTGVWGFLAARLLWGISWSFIRMEGMSTVLDLASPALGTAALRGTYMGIYQSLARLGGAAGMLVGSTLSDIVGYSSAFVLLGCLTCVAPVLAFAEYTLRSSRGSRTRVTAVRSNNNANEDDANANAKSSEKESAAEVEAGEGTNTNTFTSPTPTTPDHTRAHVAAVF
jgi:MFS family permease